MAVTIVKTPQGHKIVSDAVGATATNQSGDVIITFTSHGLTTGDYVYIDSDVDEYNGFWYITTLDFNVFKISEYDGADFVEYYQDADVDYYETTSHEWNSIFLPIVYKIDNDRWPVNSIDTARTPLSHSDDNGFTDLTVSGALRSGLQILDFVKITDSPVEEYNGVWQIIEVISDSHVVIDAPYVSGSMFGAQVQFYYNNYQVKVKVYAGLPAGHNWEDKKPYEEVAELSLTPDSDNQVMFSIADYIKGKVTIRNNPTLFSMPLNLDFFTAFYISVAESFDDSDGYTITEYESSYTDDTFEGYAMAGKLPFKNVYSGAYSDYVYSAGYPAQWLTLMDRLLAVDGRYFDLSFIKNVPGNFLIRINKYTGDTVTSTEDVAYDDQGLGAYRVPLTIDSNYDSFCVTARTDPSSDAVDVPTFASWVNSSGVGSGVDWTTGATPSITLNIQSSEYLYADFAFIEGYEYTIEIGYTKTYNSGSSNPRILTIYALDGSNNVIFSDSTATPTTPGGSGTATLTFTATGATTRMGVRADDGSNIDLDLTSLSVSVIAPDVALTEEICIDILEDCDAVIGFTPDDIRLTEDGDYRILE